MGLKNERELEDRLRNDVALLEQEYVQLQQQKRQIEERLATLANSINGYRQHFVDEDALSSIHRETCVADNGKQE